MVAFPFVRYRVHFSLNSLHFLVAARILPETINWHFRQNGSFFHFFVRCVEFESAPRLYHQQKILMHVKNASLLFCSLILSFLSSWLKIQCFFLAKAASHFSKEFSIENDTRASRRKMARISHETHLRIAPAMVSVKGEENKKLKSQSKEVFLLCLSAPYTNNYILDWKRNKKIKQWSIKKPEIWDNKRKKKHIGSTREWIGRKIYNDLGSPLAHLVQEILLVFTLFGQQHDTMILSFSSFPLSRSHSFKVSATWRCGRCAATDCANVQPLTHRIIKFHCFIVIPIKDR